MAIRNSNDFNINPSATSGTDLANILNRLIAALDTFNSGLTRPAYAQTGMIWVDVSDPQNLEIKFFDGTDDHVIGVVSSNGIVVGGAAGLSDLSGVTDVPGALFNLGLGTAAVEPAEKFLIGRKNKIINGSFRIFQRLDIGVRAYASGNEIVLPLVDMYGLDRWKSGTSGCVFKVTTTDNKTTVEVVNGELIQVVEGADIQSGNHALSWQGTAQAKIDSGPFQDTDKITQLTGGNNVTITFGLGTIENVQLEAGNSHSNFEMVNIADELLACERYMEVMYILPAGSSGGLLPVVGTNAASQLGFGFSNFRTTKRATPTVKNIGVFSAVWPGIAVDVRPFAFNAASKHSWNVQVRGVVPEGSSGFISGTGLCAIYAESEL